MWKRIKYLVVFFLVVWAYFLVQKPLFMLFNAQKSYSMADYLAVVWHASSLDATTTGYLSILPFVACVVSVWWVRMPVRKILTPYYAVVMLLVSLIFIGDLSLFSFWESKLDATVFIYIDSPKNAMASVSGWYIIGRTAVILLLAAAMSLALWRITPKKMGDIGRTSRKAIATLLALPIGALLFLVIRGGIRVSTANVGKVYFSSDQFLNLSAVNPAFNLFASMGQQARYEDEFNFYDEPRRASLMRGLYPKGDDSTKQLLNTRRPNVLVILMESFGATMFEPLGGVKGVAPNLSRLADEGVFFSNVYASSFRTDRGTVCTFSGYPGLPTLSIMKVPNLSSAMPNLARSLSRQGYTTDFLYGGDINFTNMRSYLLSGGFQRLTSQDDFPLSARNYSKWGVHDGMTFERLFNMLSTRKNSRRPWFTAFLTLSSHEPFEVPYHKLAEKRYNAFSYTDHCIGAFIERLRKTPEWRNTLIVLLPDHGTPYPKGGERFGPHFFRIPMIWTGGAVAGKKKVDCIMSQTDLAATLLAQLGISHREYAFSRNVLSRDYTDPFAFYSFNNGFAYVDSTGACVYDNVSNRVFYSEHPASGKHRIERGKAILQTLYDRLGEINKK